MREYLRNSTESDYETRANELVQSLRDTEGEPFGIVAVGGVSGTGKTNFAQRLGSKINSSLVLHIDNYLSPKNPVAYDIKDLIDLDSNQFTPQVEGLVTNAWNLPRFINDVRLFGRGALMEVPVYSPIIQEIVDKQHVDRAETLIIEGAHVLNLTPLQDEIQSRVLLEANFHDRLMRKIVRSARLNMRPSLDLPITRYINGSELAWQYYKDEYEKRADYIVENPANSTADYAHLSPLYTEEPADYQLIPFEGTGIMQDGEALKVRKNRKTIGTYVLNYIAHDEVVVSSEITTDTLELLLGYYDMERATDE